MEILSLTTEAFRNLEPVRIELHPRLSLVVGDNGQGKTNLLEAVALAAGRAPFRGPDLRAVPADGAGAALATLRLDDRGEGAVLGLEVRDGRREHFRDGARIPQLLARELLPSVFLTAEDLLRLSGPARDRRRALDRAAQALARDHAAALSAYERARGAKARLLSTSPSPDTVAVEVFEETMAVQGARVAVRRREARSRLESEITRASERVCARPTRLALPLVSDLPAEGDEASFAEGLRRAFAARRDAERAAGRCLVGPHRDDVTLLDGGVPAVGRASSGETRTLVLAWTLAEVALLSGRTGRAPFLAFDDFDSEWDPAALRRFASSLPRDGQVLLTSARPEAVRGLPFPDGALLRVSGGRVRGEGTTGGGRLLSWPRREAAV